MSDEPLPPIPNTIKAHDPGEIWELHNGGLAVIVSSRLYNESKFGTVVVCSVTTPPGRQQYRPLVVPVGADLAVYVDRINQIPTAWLIQRRGTLAAAALAEVDRHMGTLFMR